MALQAVSSCEVLVLIDQMADLHAGAPPGRALVNDMPHSVVHRSALWGLSLLITVQTLGQQRYTVLFDGGADGNVLCDNARRFRVDWGQVGAVVLSLGHRNHAGGLPLALKSIHGSNGGKKVPVHVNEDMFARRAIRASKGRGLLPVAQVPSPEDLEAAGGLLIASPNARTFCDDAFYLSGEIPRITPYEVGVPGRMRQLSEGGWVSDQWGRDERWLAVWVEGLGIIVFTGCSQAGLVNILCHAQAAFDVVPLYAVVGGVDLGRSDGETLLDDTLHDLEQFKLQYLMPAQCTGRHAIERMTAHFGPARVQASRVGGSYRFFAGAESNFSLQGWSDHLDDF